MIMVVMKYKYYETLIFHFPYRFQVVNKHGIKAIFNEKPKAFVYFLISIKIIL